MELLFTSCKNLHRFVALCTMPVYGLHRLPVINPVVAFGSVSLPSNLSQHAVSAVMSSINHTSDRWSTNRMSARLSVSALANKMIIIGQLMGHTNLKSQCSNPPLPLWQIIQNVVEYNLLSLIDNESLMEHWTNQAMSDLLSSLFILFFLSLIARWANPS